MNTSGRIQAARRRPSTKPLSEQLGDLYDAQARRAARLAFLLTGDREAADDVVQEAFARLGTRLLTLRDPDRAAAYLFRTVVNLSRGHGRGLTRTRRLAERLGRARPSLPADAHTHDDVTAALLRLPPRQRAAIFLRYYEDRSEREAAEALGCSVAALRSLTFRALETLRSQVQEERS